jgi:uncharacterized protein
MSPDDLTRPLGTPAPPEAVPARRHWLKPSLHAGIGVAVMALAVWLSLSRDPLGGEPVAIARIEKVQMSAVAPQPSAAAAPAAQDEPRTETAVPPSRQTARELEESAGVRVMRPNNASAPGSVIIRVPDANQSTRLAAANDKRITERGRHGNMPRLGPDGQRAAEVYARPMTMAQRTATVRVAIVVGGLGIGAQTTMDAVRRLPENISLAFAPYGGELERQVAQARESGHEVLIHAPMEPFDFPDNDPGPKTLMASTAVDQNQDKLHWLLSRVQGAVGVVNYMGARFASTEPALAPVVREIGQRGLFMLDDGSSGRSLIPQVAGGVGTASARADVVLDAVQKGPEIDQALARLETIARQKGSAVGFAMALPVSVERIARWARAAEGRGIVIVPVSALAPLPRRS